MKNTLLAASRSNDLHIEYDADLNKYILTVSTNRLPDIEPHFKQAQDIGRWTFQVQNELRRIGLPDDGKIFSHSTRATLDACVQDLASKGYRVDPQWKQALDHPNIDLPAPTKRRKTKSP